MYNVLVVDDEPLICKGLHNLLLSSGLSIHQVYTAHSGYEALDFIRMEEIDLLVTDIQMGAMNGIELMHQAKMIRPRLQAIIISAHENFQYAQMALRLGAKDYLIKPLNSEHFLDSVRNVLLKMDKPISGLEEIMADMDEHFHMEEPLPASTEQLNRLLENPAAVLEGPLGANEGYGLGLYGPYYAIIKLQMNPNSRSEGHFSSRDLQLFRYAALNIVQELMEQEWNATSFYSSSREISVIVQWSEKEYEEPGINKINQLEMIGRSLHYHIHKYLGMHCVIGISQILKGIEFLEILNKQAGKAIHWNQKHGDHYVFYYGDFNWNVYSSDPSEEEMSKQSNWIVEKTKQYIEENYAQKGLTIHEVAKKNHVSPNYLSYLYKKTTGYNLWEYVIKLRMEESRSLILNTDLRRYEIAEKVGYESPEHFSKIFKKYYGMSPSELKK
ncbi:response regulator [Paenibacillus sp. J22TS3]|uniref:response regulator transcription factor n=1 Tax=Paenibacillus sp. J22TS3 TaxID=2807192 RepID=UPI001B092AB7|nr:response regulator [Paenibacillus sp. J22TS3]GIP23702.1 hypothetical protein J22TS3_39770 [Paenibacillus sp. J22TS3]